MKDTVVFLASILGIVLLGVVIAAVEMTPEKISVLRGIIEGLLVILGASGRVAVPNIGKRVMQRVKSGQQK